MGDFVDVILGMPPLLAYALVFAFVFAEDAIFVGFVIPGETAAVLGGTPSGTRPASTSAPACWTPNP